MTRRVLLVVGLVSAFVLGMINLVYAQEAGPQNGEEPQAASGTAFTYQGQLKSGATAITGSCEMGFRLYDAATLGIQVGAPLTQTVMVNDGLFTTQLDFGISAFNGQARWLEIAVKCGNDAAFTTLSRQALTAAPYATYAPAAGSAPWNGLTGVPDGFADGVDNDTTYSAGTGLQLTSREFSLLGGYQLPQTCSGGQIPEWSMLTSRWGCGTDNNTTYTAGDGLALIGTEFSVTGAPWSGLTGVPAGFADGVDDVGSGWQLIGNSGTNPATNFIGTTDNQPLVFKVNNTRALRLEWNINSPNIIGGKDGNSVTAGVYGATIAGGGGPSALNEVTDDYGAIGGGNNNTAGGYGSAISGGQNNTANGYGAVVGGGCGNTTSAAGAVVGGGGCYDGGYSGNTASGVASTVAGGHGNDATGDYATVAGGRGNDAAGDYATVGGGNHNGAFGDYSFVAGRNAQNDSAAEDGVFLFADSNTPTFSSTAANQFRVRSTGGVQFVTAIDGSGNATAGVQVAAGGGSWSSISDHNLKANFAAVDGRAVLEAVTAMPVSTWNYIAQDESIRHIGPMAQDFYAAFGVGEDNMHIATIDADGVALAAIQGLNEIVQEKDARIAALEARLTALEQLAQTNNANARGDTTGNIALLVIGAWLGLVVMQKPWQRKIR